MGGRAEARIERILGCDRRAKNRAQERPGLRLGRTASALALCGADALNLRKRQISRTQKRLLKSAGATADHAACPRTEGSRNGRRSEGSSNVSRVLGRGRKSCAWNGVDSADFVPGQQSSDSEPHPTFAECMGHASAVGGHAAPATETRRVATRKAAARARFIITTTLLRIKTSPRILPHLASPQRGALTVRSLPSPERRKQE